MMRAGNPVDSDSDWDSPTENNPESPSHSMNGHDSLQLDHSQQALPKPSQRATLNMRSSPDIEHENANAGRRQERDSVSDIMAEAKIEDYQAESLPPYDFRDALQYEDGDDLSAEVNIRQPKRSPKEQHYRQDSSSPPLDKDPSSSPPSSLSRNHRKKKKRISFDLSNNRSDLPPRSPRPVEEPPVHYRDYRIPPTDFDNYDSVPQVKMEPIAERGESSMRWIYREAMTALGLVLSVFMILLEELVRIIALKIFSPVLHMVRYFLMAAVQLALDITEFTVIGFKRIAIPCIEICDIFVGRCCLPIIKAFKPINISFVTTAPLPHRVDRDSYVDV